MTSKLLPETEKRLSTTLAEAIGAASLCWAHIDRAGVFDSTEAKVICDKLIEDVKSIVGFEDPHLGLATNSQLEWELHTRRQMGNTSPTYRTVDG